MSLPPEQRSSAQLAVAVAEKTSLRRQSDLEEQKAMLKMAKVN